MVNELTIETSALAMPPLDEVAQVLSEALKENFSFVRVDVVDCPDLTMAPFNLACPGLGGNEKLIEVGGISYLLPKVDKTKVYNFGGLVEMMPSLSESFIIGAGAGPWPYVGKNCEMIANVKLAEGEIEVNGSKIVVLDNKEETYRMEMLPSNEARFCLLANLYSSGGHPSQVLRVECKKRIGEDDFISALRKAIRQQYISPPLGLGGCFLLKSGKARLHVMPSFSQLPLDTDEKLNEWLKFYEMESPLVAVGTLVSNDIPGLDLRVQHFHCMSEHGQGGHYHIDTTPDEAEYLAYFNCASVIHRVDKPRLTHMIGR